MKPCLWQCVATASVLLLVGSGCVSAPDRGAGKNHAVVRSETIDLGGQSIVGMEMLKADGSPFAYALRADHGLVVCPHFDLDGLAQGGIAAARAMRWKFNGLRGELEAPIVAVNAPAAARGVTVGMKVGDALRLLMQAGAADAPPSPARCTP